MITVVKTYCRGYIFTILQDAVFEFTRRHTRYAYKSFCEVGQRIKAQKVCNFRKSFVFADKTFTLFDFEFQIVGYNSFACMFFEHLTKRSFAVMKFAGYIVKRYFTVNGAFENANDFVFKRFRIINF